MAVSAPSNPYTASIDIASGTYHITGTKSDALVPLPSAVVNVVAGSVPVPKLGLVDNAP